MVFCVWHLVSWVEVPKSNQNHKGRECEVVEHGEKAQEPSAHRVGLGKEYICPQKIYTTVLYRSIPHSPELKTNQLFKQQENR